MWGLLTCVSASALTIVPSPAAIYTSLYHLDPSFYDPVQRDPVPGRLPGWLVPFHLLQTRIWNKHSNLGELGEGHSWCWQQKMRPGMKMNSLWKRNRIGRGISFEDACHRHWKIQPSRALYLLTLCWEIDLEPQFQVPVCWKKSTSILTLPWLLWIWWLGKPHWFHCLISEVSWKRNLTART